MGETIRRVHGYDHDAYTYIPVLIVGAGASGIAMACRLKDELGFDQFRIFDRQAGIGGTWWINRYPGVACDVPAVFYSFSFAQNPNWTSFHPPGRDIVQYYHDVCRQYKITDKFELNTDIEQCTWLEDEKLWEVRLRRMVAGMGDLSAKDRMKVVQEKGEAAVYTETEIVKAKVVVSCVGGLVEPKGWPDEIPGLEKFQGKVFHSARWDENVDFTDKNVVVVGTGCSSAQVVPRLPKAPYNAKSVVQLMRTPPWVVPAFEPPGGDEWWDKNGPTLMRNIPGLRPTLRFLVFLGGEQSFMQIFPNTPYAEKHRKKLEEQMLKRMKRIVPAKYHEMLTPDYGIGCKRRIFDKAWYQSLNNEKIELTTQPLNRVNENSVVLGPGVTYPTDAKSDLPEREFPADIIVLANGFDTKKWLHPLRVAGKGGKDLVETMDERGGPQAYQGTAMDGFPNFFMIFGPNTVTGHSSVVMASENMVNYSLNYIKLLLNGDAAAVDVKREAEERYTAMIQRALKNTVFMSGGCNSWYFTNDGWNSTGYPYSQVDFWRRCLTPHWNDWNIEYTKKGKAHIRRTRAFRLLIVALAVVGAYRAHQYGVGLKEVKRFIRQLLQRAVMRAVQTSRLLKEQALAVFKK
ncbi:FAD/NAD(P)-binding domain-containing protein [Lentithecium fluviatile CBS 122367]|uniref:FAD/NAD(P)-binding domain-containing protein n=1 Tax=Lentithecium fluviatile CBS 122367 TaxID=1168545 RepID=A0A6G1JMK8_9PLEO|nr:FAD/NAD(P)-binding domain-containing protein [Lentithecium fluviatile CBS 122367]